MSRMTQPKRVRRLICSSMISLFMMVSGVPSIAEGEARPIVAREQMNATLWMQRAAEYRLIAAQTWRMAQEKLATTLVAPGTAALEQITLPAETLAALPTAIIVDLDETVLDNTAYQARNILQGQDYDESSWQAWMQEASAPAVPGAKEFLQAAVDAGHTIIYLTNRRCLPDASATSGPCPAEAWTLANMAKLGLPQAGEAKFLLMRGERPEWASSDKSVRRAYVAQRYRILALFGDDLHDFVPRAEFAARESTLTPWVGERWFVLPNPMYGSWDRDLVGEACASGESAEVCAENTREQRYRALQP